MRKMANISMSQCSPLGMYPEASNYSQTCLKQAAKGKMKQLAKDRCLLISDRLP